MVELRPSKPVMGVRFPFPAPIPHQTRVSEVQIIPEGTRRAGDHPPSELRAAVGRWCGSARGGRRRRPIERAIADLRGRPFLVGHSLGGTFLLKYLAKERVDRPGGGLADDFASRLPRTPIFLYHSRGDTIVPVAHLRLYAREISRAVVRETTGGHQLGNDLSPVGDDIKGLSKVPRRTTRRTTTPPR